MKNWRTSSRFALLVSMLLLGVATMAQNSFRIMAVSGDVQYSTDGSSWNRARTGLTLDAEGKLKIGTKGYVALTLNGAKNYEMKESGVYSLNRLVANAGSPNQSVQSKYVDYVVNRSNSNNAGNNMSNLGAVERSMAPTPLTPRNSKVIDQNLTFRWMSQSGAPSYYFQISDINGNLIYSTETRDTFVVVDFIPLKLNVNEPYWWQIANTKMRGMRSDELSFVLVSTENRAAVEKASEEIRSNSDDPNSAICNIFLAQFYADQGINDRAMQAYEAAIAAQPDVEGYRKIYAEFLAGIGLKAYAAQILEQGGIELDQE